MKSKAVHAFQIDSDTTLHIPLIYPLKPWLEKYSKGEPLTGTYTNQIHIDSADDGEKNITIRITLKDDVDVDDLA